MKKAVKREDILVTLLAASALTPVAAHAQSAESSEGLREIVVTAQRREESLQDVPIAVTAITSEDIREQRIQNARDLNSLAPGLNVGAAPGGSQSSAITLRGVYSQPAYAGQNGGVSVYMDGVYIGSNVGQFVDLADIERIEVLRGPQGTLFGRNATGGAISITTKQPSGEFAVRAEATIGNFDQRRFKARVDLPQFGPFAASVTYLHNERRGDIRNIGAGTVWDYGPGTDGNYGLRTSPKYLGSQNVDGVVAHLKFEPTSAITFNYKFDYTSQKYTDNGQGIGGFGFADPAQHPSAAFTVGVAQVLYATQAADLRTPIGLKRPKAVNNSFTTPADLTIWGQTLTGEWQASEALTIKSILAYRKTHGVWTAGVDGFGFAGLLTPPANLLGFPTPDAVSIGDALGGTDWLGTLIGVSSNSRTRQFSEELQVNYASEKLDVTTGFLYYNEKSSSIPWLNNDNPATGLLSGLYYSAPVVPGQPIVLLNGLVPNDLYGAGIAQSFQTSFVKQRSVALYAQAELHLSDQFSIVGGVRNTWDRKRGVDAFSSAGTYITEDNVKYKQSKATWLAGVNYQATPDILVYAKATTGFISGGQLAGQIYQDETARSYEAGVKADLFNRRARINAAVYHVTYRNLQFSTTIESERGPLNGILNYGDAKANGVEIEATVLPVAGLSLSGNIGYTDFKFRGEIDPGAVTGLATQSYAVLPNGRPKWTAALVGQYETPTMPWGGNLVFRGDANFRSAIFSTPRGYDDNLDGRFDSSDQTWAIVRRSSRWILNGRIAATEIPLGPVSAEIAVWGRNLANNDDVQFTSWLSFGYSESFERARTFGLDVTVDF